MRYPIKTNNEKLFFNEGSGETEFTLLKPSADHSANGNITSEINAGETITAFNCVYLKSDGEWWKTDADDVATVEGELAIALESGTDNNSLKVALSGSYVRDDTWAWTIGSPVYISGTAGELTQTKPALAREVGIAISATVIKFEPKERDPLYAFLSLSANQTSNLSAGDHVEFDTVTGNLALSTGTGQANGKVTLKAGKTYSLEGGALASGSNPNCWCVWYDTTNSQELGQRGGSHNASTGANDQTIAAAVVTPSTDIIVELRTVISTNVSYLYYDWGTFAYIEEIKN